MVKNLNSTPLVSVLMPTYNGGDYVIPAVHSILTQTITDFELLIIDDSSSDGTIEVLKEIVDPRIQLIFKPVNSGLIDTLNLGLKVAKGKYILRMDQDDISIQNRIEVQLDFMEANPDVVVCGAGYQIIDSNSFFRPSCQHGELLLDLIDFCPFAHPTIIMRADFLKNHNISYNSSYVNAEDYKIWTDISHVGRMANLPNIVLEYRIHESQMSSRGAIQQQEMSKKISLEHLNFLSGNNEHMEYYLNGSIKNVSDLKKYLDVELSIKDYFTKNNLNADSIIFKNRSRKYFQNVLSNDNFSLMLFIDRMPLLLQIFNTIGGLYVIKYFAKSIIHWKPISK
ncbi:glycosyltransferase family 2 protein [Aquirufa sp. A-Brett2-W8]